MKVLRYKRRYRIQILPEGYRAMKGETEIGFFRSIYPGEKGYKLVQNPLEEAIKAIEEDRSGQRKGD